MVTICYWVAKAHVIAKLNTVWRETLVGEKFGEFGKIP